MRATDLFDQYIFGTLSADDKKSFELRLASDAEFKEAFEKHKELISQINEQEQRLHLKQILSTIHQQEFGKDAKILPIKEEGFIKKHGKTVAVAVSVGIIAVISTITILSTGGYLLKQQSNAIVDLKRDVTELKYSQGAIIEGIKGVGSKKGKTLYAPANIEGTGFALNNKGYFVTSWHLVKNSDSVFIANNFIDRTSAKLVFSEPSLDIAIFKMDNTEKIESMSYPVSFKKSGSDIGDKIFTLGYPRREIVYGEGALSSLSGFNNDTTMYQISIPVNPGNSGGPLLDENGNLIGVIRGKQTQVEATAYAVKSDLIMKTIQSMEDESLKNEILTHKGKGSLKGLKRSDQVKKLQPFVFNVMVYKK